MAVSVRGSSELRPGVESPWEVISGETATLARQPHTIVSMSPYAKPQSAYDPAAIAADMHAALAEGLALFAGIDEALSRVRPSAGGWCAREVVGHLIDSACNNHRRFILGQTPGLARFDGYDGDAWVARQQYVDESWEAVVGLWAA